MNWSHTLITDITRRLPTTGRPGVLGKDTVRPEHFQISGCTEPRHVIASAIERAGA